jgi:hypothetical protein
LSLSLVKKKYWHDLFHCIIAVEVVGTVATSVMAKAGNFQGMTNFFFREK